MIGKCLGQGSRGRTGQGASVEAESLGRVGGSSGDDRWSGGKGGQMEGGGAEETGGSQGQFKVENLKVCFDPNKKTCSIKVPVPRYLEHFQWTLINMWSPLYHLLADLGCKTWDVTCVVEQENKTYHVFKILKIFCRNWLLKLFIRMYLPTYLCTLKTSGAYSIKHFSLYYVHSSWNVPNLFANVGLKLGQNY